jgi:hypothetical protein
MAGEGLKRILKVGTVAASFFTRARYRRRAWDYFYPQLFWGGERFNQTKP